MNISNTLDNLGFLSSGVGATYFLFIYSFIVETSIFLDLSKTYLAHTVQIRSCWLKNKKNKEKNDKVEKLNDSESYDKSDWSIGKRFAFWSMNYGVVLCFLLVFIGFLLQLIAKTLK
ncbi:hypothetical protein [Thiofilum flexile]|uniref:hypothetical protein n=1 Tax=Thiofilum flexile TaxID=125627 RepID=UPI00035C7DDA|nr:hypothetical protein [Thiofilum flexile]